MASCRYQESEHRLFSPFLTKLTISSKEFRGGKHHLSSFRREILSGMTRPEDTGYHHPPRLLDNWTTLGKGDYGTRKDSLNLISILLDGGAHNVLRGLAQAGIDYLHAGVRRAPGNTLGTVAVSPGLPRNSKWGTILALTLPLPQIKSLADILRITSRRIPQISLGVA